jgi:tol-pal system protein YbgF
MGARRFSIGGPRSTARMFSPVANLADRALTVVAQAPKGRRLSHPIRSLAAALLAASFALAPSAGVAQQDSPPQEPRAGQAGQTEEPSGEAGESAVSQLGPVQEQLNELRAMVGALESLVKSKPGAVLPQETAQGQGPGAGAQGDLGVRVDALETQIGALTSQLEHMTQQLNALEARLAGGAQPQRPPAAGTPGRQGAASPQGPDAALAGAGGDGGEDPSFNTVAQAGEDQPPLSQMALQEGGGPGEPLPPANDGESPGDPAAQGQPQRLMAGLPGNDATSLYNQGYGNLLRRDYAGAETAFGQLVQGYPNDPLAGKAQYWLGETYYVRGQYKDAAGAFLKGYKRYKSGEKAPDSLLKLGMSLAALGQKTEACSAFSELGTKYPAAADFLRDQAKSERRKVGC